MACFTSVAEKNWSHYGALSPSAMQTWLGWGAWDLGKDVLLVAHVPLGCSPRFLCLFPSPWFCFPSRQQAAPAIALSQWLPWWRSNLRSNLFVLWLYREQWIELNQSKEVVGGGEMSVGTRNMEGYSQALYVFLLFYTFPCVLNF